MKLLPFPQGRMARVLIAVNAVLACAIVAVALLPASPTLPPPQPPDLGIPSGAGVTASALADPTLGDSYELLISQPIFHRDRQYTPPPKADTAVAQSPPPDFAMTGFMQIPGRPPKAFLRERSGGRSLTVSNGDNVDGWIVTDLDSRRVGLSQGGRRIELGKGERAAPMAAPAAPLAAAPVTSSTSAPVIKVETPREPGSGSQSPSNPLAPPDAPKPKGDTAGSAAKTRPVASSGSREAPGQVLQNIQVLGLRPPKDFGPPVEVVPKGPLHTFSQAGAAPNH